MRCAMQQATTMSLSNKSMRQRQFHLFAFGVSILKSKNKEHFAKEWEYSYRKEMHRENEKLQRKRKTNE